MNQTDITTPTSDVSQLNRQDAKRITKAWGKVGLELLKEADVLLRNDGFVGIPVGDDARYLTWGRTHQLGISQEIVFECFEHEGARYFRTHLLVHSKYVRTVLNDIKEWECFETTPEFAKPQEAPTCVLNAGQVEWWADFHERRDFLLKEKIYRAWQVADKPEPEVAAWHQAFLQYGKPIFAAVSSPEGVVNFLQNIDKYPNPRSGYMGAPGSADRETYTAILLYSIGRIKDALKELDIEEARLKAFLARDEYYRRGFVANMCKIGRLRAYFTAS